MCVWGRGVKAEGGWYYGKADTSGQLSSACIDIIHFVLTQVLDRSKAGERQWEAEWGVASINGVFAGREGWRQPHHPVKSKQVERTVCL